MPPQPQSLQVRYLGGATALLEIDGLRLLTDPTFDPAGTLYPINPTVSLKKLIEPRVAAAELGRIDAVLLTHDQHPDNLDHAGRALLGHVPRTLTTPAAAGRLGGSALALAPWQATVLPTPNGNSLRITATPARHGPAGCEAMAGEVTGFVLSLDGPGLRSRDLAYITGDTVFYEGVRAVAARFRPEMVLLYGGASNLRGWLRMTMDTNDAIETAVAFPEALIVPIHYEGWNAFTQGLSDLQNAFSAMGLAARLRPLAD